MGKLKFVSCFNILVAAVLVKRLLLILSVSGVFLKIDFRVFKDYLKIVFLRLFKLFHDTVRVKSISRCVDRV